MALPFTITLLSPLIIVSGGESTQGISYPGEDVQFGIVEQIYPSGTTVSVGQYIAFETKDSKALQGSDGITYFQVPDTKLFYIEAPPA